MSPVWPVSIPGCVFAILLAVSCAVPALAAEPCAPPGWTAAPILSAAVLPTEQPVHARLEPVGALHLPAGTRSPSGGYGTVLAFDTTRPGRWRILLSAKAWIDVIEGSTPIASVAHQHGAACSPVRKMVDFDLNAGHHLIVLTGAPAQELVLEVAAQSAR